MRILIDLTQIPVCRAGVAVYALNLVNEIRVLHTSIKFYFLVIDDDDDLIKIILKSEEFYILRINASVFRKNTFRLLMEQIYIPYLALRHSIDLIHSLHYSFPYFLPRKCKRVVTVHDMTFYLYPNLHLSFKRHFFRFFIGKLNKVNGLIFVSESTKNDFLKFFPKLNNKGTVIHLGVNSELYGGNVSIEDVKNIRSKYALSKYILFIGTIEPRKNVLNLIKAFEKIQDQFPFHILLIAGKLGWDYEDVFSYVEKNKLGNRIKFIGYFDEEEKPKLLKGAELFVYPSIYEGFGIPVLESMASGTATITSNISSMPEVSGEGAYLIDPFDVNEIGAAMVLLLNDKNIKNKFIEAGIERSRAFSWRAMAVATVAYYNALLTQKS